jgi:hypothetical protein
MPRDRVVTMGKVTPREAHDAALKKAIKLHSPYVIIQGSLVNSTRLWAVVFAAPMGGDREVVMQSDKMSSCTRLRNRLNRAWAQGYWASSSKGQGI